MLAAAPLLCGGAPEVDPLYAAYDARRAELLKALAPRLLTTNDVKFVGYDLVAWTALHGCGPAEMADRMVDTVRPDLVAKSVDKAAYAFVLPPLTRYIFQYGRCLGPEQSARLARSLATPQQLFSYGTSNHTLMSATSFYLLAQRFPAQAWTGADGKAHTSADVMSQYRALLLARLRKTLTDGFDEQLSPTYAEANLYPLLNLIDFAADSAVRRAAEAAAVAQIATLRADSFGGAIVAPFNRETADQPQLNDDPDTNARDTLWLYYGTKPFSGRPIEPAYASLLATAKWRPPLQLLALRGRDGPTYEIVTRTPSFTIWDRPTYPQLVGSALVTPDFAIGAGDVAEKPSSPQVQSEAFAILLKDRRPVGVIQCYQPYWRSDMGEDAWAGDLSSPFQQSVRVGDRGVLLYDIPARDPWPPNADPHAGRMRQAHANGLLQTVKCRIPDPPDEIWAGPSGIAVRYGEVMVALRSAGGGLTLAAPGKAASGFAEYRIHASAAALYFRVAKRAPGAGLDQFRRQVWATPIRYDPVGGAVSFPDARNRTVEVTINRDRALRSGVATAFPTVRINGALSPLANGAVISSPEFELGDGGFKLRTSRGTLSGDVNGVAGG